MANIFCSGMQDIRICSAELPSSEVPRKSLNVLANRSQPLDLSLERMHKETAEVSPAVKQKLIDVNWQFLATLSDNKTPFDLGTFFTRRSIEATLETYLGEEMRCEKRRETKSEPGNAVSGSGKFATLSPANKKHLHWTPREAHKEDCPLAFNYFCFQKRVVFFRVFSCG